MDRHKIAKDWAEQCSHVAGGVCIECAVKMIGCVILDVRVKCADVAENSIRDAAAGVAMDVRDQ